MKQDVEKLTNLRQYPSLGSDSMRTALAKADLRAVAKGIVEPSDSITFTWRVANHRPGLPSMRWAKSFEKTCGYSLAVLSGHSACRCLFQHPVFRGIRVACADYVTAAPAGIDRNARTVCIVWRRFTLVMSECAAPGKITNCRSPLGSRL